MFSLSDDIFDPDDTEELRQELLDEIYAGAFAGGIPAMLLDEDDIRCASPSELQEIARRYGCS